jgi:hypothetical protein
MIVSVKTTAKDPEDDVLTYNYIVSAGRIVGTGANVSWNLNGVQPGTYTITAGVDDGCGICGAKLTKTISVLEADAVPPCICPDISIDVRESVKSTDLIFTAQMKNAPINPTYNWFITEGTLISGQGTNAIRVGLPQQHTAMSATVTIQIGGLDIDCACPTTASRSY